MNNNLIQFGTLRAIRSALTSIAGRGSKVAVNVSQDFSFDDTGRVRSSTQFYVHVDDIAFGAATLDMALAKAAAHFRDASQVRGVLSR